MTRKEAKHKEILKKAIQHILDLAGDYKCYDNQISYDEALELSRILEDEQILWRRKMTATEREAQEVRLQGLKNRKMETPLGFLLHVGTIYGEPGLHEKCTIAKAIAHDIVCSIRWYSEEFDFDFDYEFLLEINKEVDEEIKRRLTFNDNSEV
jgi:hypothetical protein